MKQVARELGVRYVLEGSVRKAGNRVRIAGQLIDSTTGAHIWADRFDGTLDDVFELQDRVAGGVVGAIEPRLRRAEAERAGPQADREPRCLRPLPARPGASVQKDQGELGRVDSGWRGSPSNSIPPTARRWRGSP